MLGYVIGDANMVTGFRLVGVEGVEATSENEALQALNKALTRSDIAVVIISEEISTQPQLREKIDRARLERREPLIVEVPGSKGTPSQTQMSDIISKTLGVRI
jgi:V/A-type H+/Na+-transporting ATPase subunit F